MVYIPTSQARIKPNGRLKKRAMQKTQVKYFDIKAFLKTTAIK